MATNDGYRATFTTDGSGDWSIALPADIDEYDFKALGPVIEGMKSFLAPTVEVSDVDAPIGLLPTEDHPDLTA